ncbi:methyl-accepting chemotaxis protein [Paucibacter sp. JuS9]|uniref:methyl-accepting chemotaxis protein n=1 Tax=Roseateles TaxID=93681 RepID=UPI002FE519CF
MNMSDMKISTRLTLGFGLLTAIIALISAIAFVRMDQVDEDFDLVLEDRMPKVLTLSAMIDRTNDIARGMRDMLLLEDKAALQKQRTIIDAARKIIGDSLDQLDKSISSEKGRAGLKAIQDARNAYIGGQSKFLELVDAGKIDEARTLLTTQLSPLQTAYMTSIEQGMDFQTELMKQSGERANSNLSAVKTVLLVAAVIALLAAVALALWIIRAITGPVNHAVEVARAVADGDLSRDMRVEGKNETAQLLRALATMQQKLNSVVSEVRMGSESVATASAQIAQGNQDLSQRTEEQASALEETAASMEQLGSTVRQNADNAQQANQLAMSASTTAVEGGQVVGRVVETMKGINESSQRISDIIGVIDGIAFQTNILALNAAVEAARAGEQGRGFAVVASEVRSLAKRSADAAKEIKSLISTSVERVSAGTQLVDEAGAKMQDIVASIRRVSDIVGEISAASTEQSSGVAQIGEAVTQMDQVTQQNAALVEESAAAAESLKVQATQLVQAVAFFKLSHGQSGLPAAPAPRPAAAPRPAQRPAAATTQVTAARPVAATGGGEWSNF